MRLKAIPVLLLLLLFAIAFASAQSKKPLTNSDIIQMVKAGFTEQTITDAIKANDTAFDTSVQGLMALKNAGVSQNIIDAMLSAEAAKRAQPQPAEQPAATPPTTSSSGGSANQICARAHGSTGDRCGSAAQGLSPRRPVKNRKFQDLLR